MAKKVGSNPEFHENYKKGLERLKKELKQIRNVNVLRAVLMIEKDAKHIVPVVTGRLRASITHEIDKQPDVTIGRVGTIVEYAAIVEFGIGRKAKPYLYPALRKNQAKIQHLLINDIKRLNGEDLSK
jgi:HK97 gp10 family phage protein